MEKITINLNALSQDARQIIQAQLDKNLYDIPDKVNEEALNKIRYFEENK